jgi:hypothetical protein
MHLSAAALASGDDRFLWDMHWGGDFDLVDYVKGRATFLAEYQAVLGNEFQPFDPHQGNYTLAASGSWRTGVAEFVGVFNHVSRHLGDRPKRFGIAWNVLMARALKDVDVDGTILGVGADAGYVTHRAFVDYAWIAALDLRAYRQVSARIGWYARLHGETFGVNEGVAQRQGQQGGNIEAGVRISGGSALMELFAGYAKVIDADPIGRQPGRWGFVGFRLLNN